jgi:spermidine synthase
MSAELRDLNAMVYRALREAFPHVRPIPGDVTLWLASSSDELSTASLATLAARWEERGLETQLITVPHIRLKLEQRRLDWFWTSLGEARARERGQLIGAEGRRVNRDLRPIGLFHGLSYWNALFSPRLSWIFAFASRLSLWTLTPLLVGCMLLFLANSRSTGKGTAAVIPVVIATTGAAGMAADLIFVFAFQTLYGYVYHWIGLLIAAFMAGLGLGGLVGTRRSVRSAEARPALLKLEGALVLYWILLPVLLGVLHSGISHPLVFAFTQGVLTALNALAGFLVGFQFPLANKIWMESRGDRKGVAGALYAWDLVGAFLGAIVVSVILIPVLGLLGTCLLAAMLKAGSFLLALSGRGLRRPTKRPV